MNNMCEINWDLTIKAATLIVAMITAGKLLIEYTSSQQWKRAEFLASEYSKFINSAFVQASLNMLDGFQCKLNVLEPGYNIEIDYKIGDIDRAFHTDEHKNYSYDDKHIKIRLCIDKFLFRLGLFQVYIENKLITKEALRPYIIYWIKMLGSETSLLPQATRKKIIDYINENEIQYVKLLIKTYGHTI